MTIQDATAEALIECPCCHSMFVPKPWQRGNEQRGRKSYCSMLCSKGGDPLDRIMAHITFLSNGCWECSVPSLVNGYPRIRAYGRKVLVHRWMHEYFIGKIPDGMDTHHKCHDPNTCLGGLCRHRLCVCPWHLKLITHKENCSPELSSIGRFNASRPRQTHCIHGHELTEENAWRRKDGTRQCRACHRLTELARYHRLKEQEAA